MFPHGLYRDYTFTNEVDSKLAIESLATRSSYAPGGGDINAMVVRETSYIVNAYRYTQKLGNEAPNYERSVDWLVGMFTQWFVSKNDAYLKPFMIGLAFESLIQYYEESNDPRIPYLMVTAADELWKTAWMNESRGFFYENQNVNNEANWRIYGAPDLNLLIAPAYAWVWQLTGDPKYQDMADQIFSGGVEGAYLGPKQFSQNYKWSFDFVEWRTNPVQKPVPGANQGMSTDDIGNSAAVIRMIVVMIALCLYL